MQYFKHFTKMRADTKIRRLFAKYGLEGYGLYNLIIESIAGSIDTVNPLPFLEETCEDIASFYNGNSAKIDEMVRFVIEIGLLDIDTTEKKVACFKIYAYLEQSQTRSEKIRELITSYKDKRQMLDGQKCLGLSETKVIEKTKKRKDEDNTNNKKEKKVFIPPTLEEVKAYCYEKGYTINEKVFFDHYDSLDWKDKQGTPVQNWKNKVVNWASKDYNQVQRQSKPVTKKGCPACGGEIFNSTCRKCGVMLDAKGDILS